MSQPSMSQPPTSQPLAPAAAVPRPTRVEPPELPGVGALLTLAVGVVVVAALYLAREVLIPITLALLLSFLLAPVVTVLRRLRLGRVAPVILAVVLALGVTLGIGTLIGTQVAGLASDLPRYQDTIEQKIETARAMTLGRIATMMRGVGKQLQGAAPKPAAAAAPTGGAPKPVQVEVQAPAPSPLSVAESVLAPVLSPLGTLVIVVVFTVFMMLQRDDLRDRMIRLFGSHDLHRTTMAMNDAAFRLSRYFLAQFAVNAAFGVIVGVGLTLIGVPSAPLWGVMGLLLRFVPYVGPWLAAAIPLALAAAVAPGWSPLLWTLALYGCTEFVIGQAVEPMLYGRSTGLSPFAVVVAATFWTWLWGPIGLILSTPLTLCLVVLGRHVERLEFLDVLLGDRPALTPAEGFYQRMLAGDPDEAFEQAEQLLRERSLVAYYDEVGIAGLRMAANDASRGVLTASQMQHVRAAAAQLIAELGGREDNEPTPPTAAEEPAGPVQGEADAARAPAPGQAAAPAERAGGWQHPTPVLCLAARGPLDDSAAAILAQLLAAHGLGARVAAHDAAAREHIAALDLPGVAMVCIMALEIAGTPSYLRYLIRRLRQRAPGVRVLVGLWRPDDTVLRDDRLRAAIGADVFATTLREAVEACLEAARPQAPPEAPLLPAADLSARVAA